MENNFTAYIMVGIPGSGKSTWIKNNLGEDIPVISRDIIRANIGITKSADEKVAASFEDEKKVTGIEYKLIDMYAKSGVDFVIDDTNISKHRKSLIDHIKSLGGHIVAVRLNTPLDVCIKRREGQIDGEAMKKIHGRVKELNQDEYDELINVEYKENKNDGE